MDFLTTRCLGTLRALMFNSPNKCSEAPNTAWHISTLRAEYINKQKQYTEERKSHLTKHDGFTSPVCENQCTRARVHTLQHTHFLKPRDWRGSET